MPELIASQIPRVTPESVPEVDRRRVLVLVFGLLAFLIVANLVASVLLDRHPVNRSNWLVTKKWELVDHGESAETLLLGDSSCSLGVRTDVLDATLKTRSVNLCTVGNMLAIGDVWMLTEYIRLHGVPAHVIVVHVYDAWSREVDHGFAQLLGKIRRPWGFWTELDPAIDLGPSQLEEVAISRWLPLYGENASLTRLLETPWRGRPERFEVDRGGFMAVTRPNPARVRTDAERHLADLPGLATPAAALSASNRRAVARLAEVAAEHHIEITIVPAPIYEGLWNEPAVQRQFEMVRAQLRSVLGTSSNVKVFDGAPRTYRAEQMENVDHVVGESARDYSSWLATVVAPSFGR